VAIVKHSNCRKQQRQTCSAESLRIQVDYGLPASQLASDRRQLEADGSMNVSDAPSMS
jgi:hypothetical protein